MKKPLLMVIDMQEGWRHKTATEAAMLKAVELCKKFAGEVIHCCFINDSDSLFYTDLRWNRFFESFDTDEITEIAPLNLPKYWRSTYSCLNDETRPIIENSSEVYIAGVFTDISVASTAMDIFDMNVAVNVVSDCVASLHGQAVHEAALRSLESALGAHRVITSEQVPIQ